MGDFRKILEPHAMALFDRVDALSDEEIAELIDACGKTSETNCWFVSYAVAKAMRPIAESIQYGRACAARAGGIYTP